MNHYPYSYAYGTKLSTGFGSELIINGSFTGNADGWTLGAGWAYDSNNITATAATGDVTQSGVGLQDNETYLVIFTLSGYADGAYRITINGNTGSLRALGTIRNSNGTFAEELTIDAAMAAPADTVNLLTTINGTVTVDDISVKRVL